MASLPPAPFDPYNPIPNDPFYSPETNYLQGPLGPLVVGSGINVSNSGVISSSGNDSGGTVTSVVAGAGLTGGAITTSGTIALAASGVIPGTYNFATVEIDSSGRVVSASTGSPVTGVTANLPLTVSGPTSAPTLSINQASTLQVGVTQLNNTTTSNLTNQALTAAAGKNLQDQINALFQSSSGLILAGTLDASTTFVQNVTTLGAAQGFASGSPVPGASVPLNNYYVIVVKAAASYTPTGGTPISNVNVGDYIVVANGSWTILRLGPPAGNYATTTTAGLVELATSVEAVTGTDPNVVITPFTGAAAYLARKCFTAPGQILVGTGGNTYSALNPSTDGYVLTLDSSCSRGMKWAAGGGGGGTSVNMTFTAPLSSTTNPFTGGATNITIASASTAAAGAVQLADNTATAAGTSTALAVTPAGAASVYFPFCDYTAKGQIAVATGSNAYCVLPVGPDNCVLTACTACSSGVYWGPPAAVPAATPTTLGTVYGVGQPGAGQNMSVGSSSLQSLTTGLGNTALGIGAMALSTTACCNVAVGICALYSETTGCFNTAVGTGASKLQNGDSDNTAVGFAALGSNTSCQNNAFGSFALCALTTGCGNVGIGWITGDSLTTGYYNVLVGNGAGGAMTSGFCNTIVGTNAGAAITTGNNNIFIGDNAGQNVTTQGYQYVFGAFNSCTTGNANGGVTFQFGGGCAIYASANGSNTWTAVSDERLKENVADLALGLDFVNQLQPRTFNWKADGAAGAGFVAQEVAEVVDEHEADYLHLVDRTNEYMGLSATTLIPVLVNAIKELKAELDELKKKLD